MSSIHLGGQGKDWGIMCAGRGLYPGRSYSPALFLVFILGWGLIELPWLAPPVAQTGLGLRTSHLVSAEITGLHHQALSHLKNFFFRDSFLH